MFRSEPDVRSASGLQLEGLWAERVEGIDAGADDYLVKPQAIDPRPFNRPRPEVPFG
jgi:hypothetical protein